MKRLTKALSTAGAWFRPFNAPATVNVMTEIRAPLIIAAAYSPARQRQERAMTMTPALRISAVAELA